MSFKISFDNYFSDNQQSISHLDIDKLAGGNISYFFDILIISARENHLASVSSLSRQIISVVIA